MMIIQHIIILNPVFLALPHILEHFAFSQILQLGAMPVVVIAHVAGQEGGVVEQGEGERFEAETGPPDWEMVALVVGLFG